MCAKIKNVIYKIREKQKINNNFNFKDHVEKTFECIKNGNFSLASKLLKQVNENYVDNISIVILKFKVCMAIKDFKGAYELALELPDDMYLEKMVIFLYFNDKNMVQELYDTYFKEESYDTNNENRLWHNMLKYASMGFLGIEITDELYKKIPYSYRQSYKYSKEAAIDHIKRRHLYREESNAEASLFNENINIEYIYDYVDKYIKNHPEDCYIDRNTCNYVFSYKNVGVNSVGEKSDYILAVATLTEKNILTLYPIDKQNTKVNEFDYPFDLEMDRPSNMDKFIKKYGFK